MFRLKTKQQKEIRKNPYIVFMNLICSSGVHCSSPNDRASRAAACFVACLGRPRQLLSRPVLAGHGDCSFRGSEHFYKLVPYPPYSEQVYILHREYFSAIASRTFVFCVIFPSPLVCLVSPREFLCHACACVHTPKCSLFPIFRHKFPSAAECRTLRLRSPALLRLQSLSVAPLFCEILWVFLRTSRKYNLQLESFDHFLDLHHHQEWSNASINQSDDAAGSPTCLVVCQGYSGRSVLGYFSLLCVILRHLFGVSRIQGDPPFAVIVRGFFTIHCRIWFFALSPNFSVFFAVHLSATQS